MCTVTDEDGTENAQSEISYGFVPGPFLETYIAAVQNPDTNYLLVVEEINRANPAAAFGDVFQLLDRDSDGRSEYEIAVPREMHEYLRVFLPEYATTAHIQDPERLLSEQLRLKDEVERLSLPPQKQQTQSKQRQLLSKKTPAELRRVFVSVLRFSQQHPLLVP